MTEATPSAAPSRGPLATLVGIVLRPRKTMAALSEAKRRWWLIPAALLLIALIVHGIAYANANADYVYQLQVKFFESMPAEERGPMNEPPPQSAPHPLTVALPIGGRVVSAVVTWLIWAGLIALASTLLGHNGTGFGALFAMVVWARVPVTLRYLVQAIAMTLSGTPIYNQGLSGLVLDGAPPPMSRSFQTYVPPTRSAQVLAALLGKVDIYMVWTLILTALGIWAFAHVPKRRAVLITLGIWIIATLVTLLPAIVGIGQGMNLF
jgi:hypothetical protein